MSCLLPTQCWKPPGGINYQDSPETPWGLVEWKLPLPSISASMKPAAGKGRGDEMADSGDMSSRGLAASLSGHCFFVEAAGNGLRRRTDKKLMRSKAQHVLQGSQEPENALSFGPNWCYREQGTGHGNRPARRGLGVFWVSEMPVASLLTRDFWFWNLCGWENPVPSDPQRCVGIN